jgi:hypothetical protein
LSEAPHPAGVRMPAPARAAATALRVEHTDFAI